MNGAVSTNGKVQSYYGRPVIKPPSWRAYIPLYFFTGGLAGASATLAVAARLGRNGPLARSAVTGAAAFVSVSPLLLVADLRDPKRFMNMFRMFKVTSPMSVGSWVLAAFSAAATTAAAAELTGRARPLGRAAEVAAALIGPLVATYTAGLIANTAVPIWHDAYEDLPFLFAGGSIASASAFALLITPPGDAALARRLCFLGVGVEAASLELMHRKLGKLIAQPYRHGAAGRYKNAARLLTLAGLALLPAARRSAAVANVSGLCTLAGALAERFSVFEAGKQSARDPKYVVEPQRKRLEQRTSTD